MSKPTVNSGTPKIESISTPTLSPCSVPYRWILHVGRCVSVYFDKSQPQAIWEKHSHPTVQILIFGKGADCTIHWEEKGEWRQLDVNGPHLWIIGADVAHRLNWNQAALRLVFYVEPLFVIESAGVEITGSVLLRFETVIRE